MATATTSTTPPPSSPPPLSSQSEDDGKSIYEPALDEPPAATKDEDEDEETEPGQSPPRLLPPPNRISLQVGERLFETTRDTLTSESDYFRARLSSRWMPPPPTPPHNEADDDGKEEQQDGKKQTPLLFVDSDPHMFSFILGYLRTGFPPLFFDSATLTHDTVQYRALLIEARYFQIPSLIRWLEEGKYLEMVKVKRTATVVVAGKVCPVSSWSSSSLDVSGGGGGGNSNNEIITIDNDYGTTTTTTTSSSFQHNTPSETTKVTFHLASGVRKVYICPRNIPVHRGRPEYCGQRCHRAGFGEKDMYEDDPYVRLVRMEDRTSIVFQEPDM